MRSADGSACHQVPYPPGHVNVPLPPGPNICRDFAGSVTTDRFKPKPRPTQYGIPRKGYALLLVGQPVGADQMRGLFGQHAQPVERVPPASSIRANRR